MHWTGRKDGIERCLGVSEERHGVWAIYPVLSRAQDTGGIGGGRYDSSITGDGGAVGCRDALERLGADVRATKTEVEEGSACNCDGDHETGLHDFLCPLYPAQYPDTDHIRGRMEGEG